MKEKNKYGQYFTIEPVAKFMCGLITHHRDSKVLEPSCGEGVFLATLDDLGFTDVVAYEIDKSLSTRFDCVRYESFISANVGNFDVVIGNPPYIRWKNLEVHLKKELETSRLWNKYFNSLCDYLFIFILKSIESMNDDGELIFICTDYWLNTTNSISLRNYMVECGSFSDIYHFKEAPLFDGVCASFMIFRYVKGNKQNTITLHKYNNERVVPTLEDMQAGSCFTTIQIPQFKKNERWLLLSEEEQEFLSKFEQRCYKPILSLFQSSDLYRIGDVCDIGNGMVSGLDKAFNITSIDTLTECEEAATIKVLKAKDLKQYNHISESRYFFLTESIKEAELVEYYPNIYKHLIQYKTDLEKRYDYNKNIPYWEFVFPRNYRLFSRKEKRILVPCKERISNKDYFRFSLANFDYIPLQDVTGILKKKECKESIEYIVSFLNSRFVFEWLRNNGIIKGHIVEFSEAPIASIPYRPIDWDSPYEVELHNRIKNNVDEFIKNGDESLVCENNKFLDSLLS